MTEDERCPCHGKTEAELAMPYAMFVFSLPLIMLVVVVLTWVGFW